MKSEFQNAAQQTSAVAPLLSSLAAFSLVAGCVYSEPHPRPFPEKALEHRQTRGNDPRPETIPTGPLQARAICEDGTVRVTPGYDRHACDEHGGIRTWKYDQ